MAKKYTKKYDSKEKEYTFYKHGDKEFRLFRTGLGGPVEWTGISKLQNAWGFPSFRTAVIEMMGWDDFKRYMKGRRRP